ncbi:hypothetical protein C8F01DRAFT_949794, partial [Mycena amicta]
DRVVLNTTKRRKHFLGNQPGRVAKFMVRSDGPFEVLEVFDDCSTVKLNLKGHPLVHPIFHMSEIEPFIENDASLFPNRVLAQPTAIVSPDGQEEFLVERIIDERRRRGKRQFKIRWFGYGAEDDEWVDEAEVGNLEHLDAWEA